MFYSLAQPVMINDKLGHNCSYLCNETVLGCNMPKSVLHFFSGNLLNGTSVVRLGNKYKHTTIYKFLTQ